MAKLKEGILTPAYGRDYKNKAAVIKDFRDGLDFILNTHRGSTYCSIRDFEEGAIATIRYAKLAKVLVERV